MIEQDKRKAIYLLHEEGLGVRELSRRLHVSTNTVISIIAQKGVMPDGSRKDKISIDQELLRRLHLECQGYVQRIHEKLSEEEGVNIGYSTLTRMIRETGLGQPKNERCDRVPDKPGAEQQHDTSVYNIKLGSQRSKVVGSVIYLRYSKIRYLKFYRVFNRFTMKCFIHEALTLWGYSAPVCIIDNTNLARLRGTGRNAVIVPEMEQFARQYNFKFVCHEIGHANRKAGNERSFYTVETNFFPGREFESLEDMNRQAFDWATVRLANRPVSKTGLIPAKAFEYEQTFLQELQPYTNPPYLVHTRGTDQYGYAMFDGNYYWVPGTSRLDVKLLQYGDYLKIYHKRSLLAEYKLPPFGVKNEKFSPPGQPKSRYQPKNRKKPTAGEEKQLRALGKDVENYLEFAVRKSGKAKHRFIRSLYRLHKKTADSLFVKAIQRANKYRITNIETVESIIVLLMRDGNYTFPVIDLDEEFRQRESYLEGRFTDDVDMSVYKLSQKEKEDE